MKDWHFPPGVVAQEQARTEHFILQLENRKTPEDELIEASKHVCLQAYTKFTANKRTLLHTIARGRRVGLMKALIARGELAHIPADSEPLLRSAASSYDTEMVKLVLSAGMGDISDSQPVYNAVNMNEPDILSLLLEAGLPTGRSNDGDIPLFDSKSSYLIEKLCKAGADVNVSGHKTKNGTLISYFADEANYSGNNNVINMLFGFGANMYFAGPGKNAFSAIAVVENNHTCDFMRRSQQQYRNFVETGEPPLVIEPLGWLLSATPLADPHAAIDQPEHVRRIVMHANWKDREQAEGVLTQMQENGRLSAAEVDDMLNARFPRERTQMQGRMR